MHRCLLPALLLMACQSSSHTSDVTGDPRPCPDGTVRYGDAPPAGYAQWCRKRVANAWVYHGPFMAWHDNGQRQAMGEYRDGKGHGRFRMWYRNGQLRADGTIVDGQRRGRWRSWHMGGGLAIEAVFEAGEENGPWRSYWEEGFLSATGQMYNGWEEGYWMFWHPNGRPAQAGMYQEGQRTGWWPQWDRDGNPLPMVQFESNVEIASGQLSPRVATENQGQQYRAMRSEISVSQ